MKSVEQGGKAMNHAEVLSHLFPWIPPVPQTQEYPVFMSPMKIQPFLATLKRHQAQEHIEILLCTQGHPVGSRILRKAENQND